MSIQAAVDRGLEIIRKMEILKEELALLEKALEQAALNGDQIELEDPERDGRQYLATGTGEIVPVVITADVLTKSFVYGSKKHTEIEAAACGKLSNFFVSTRAFKSLEENGKLFRRQAREILGAEAAAPFITACVSRDKHGIPKNAIKIEWSRATAIKEGVPA